MAMKPKVALVKDGFLPAGSENVRGRLSAAAIERCMELASQGWDIEGYEAKGSVAEGDREVKKVAAPVGEKVIHDIVYRFPLDTPATAVHGGKTIQVSMRSACGNCRVSLVCCTCGMPNIVRPDGTGSMPVTIKGYND
jgi:hypothetical protein